MNSTPLKKSIEELIDTAKTLKVVAHPVRLQVLEVLENEISLSVSAISDSLSTSVEQSMLSHHLIKMRDNGILRSKKVGKYNHYSLLNKNLLSILRIKK